ncbi:MAG TPA: hypothetical protein DD786_03700, partial [Porphyromonadaceae bacterium]|nr:hypothetical protein [Porphyromonadaceae bacterium]HBU44411.1 hypothetical protein [Porphyromonadaceae bacterium]
MKDKEIFTERLSRRGFLGAAAAATAASVIPFSTSYGSTQSSAPGKGIPNSKFSGV